jgi:c-di-GMP-binding flagellar brake protein YcgR
MYVLERPADARTFQRRQTPRICAYLPVSYEYHRGETPVRVLGWTRDIGIGGLCLSAAEKPEASFLRLSVELPQDDGTIHIPCRGEVRSARTDAYTGKVLCGVMFRGLEPEEEELITRYVSRSERLAI